MNLTPRHLSNLALERDYEQKKANYKTSCNDFHFRASSLPCDLREYDDGISSPFFLNKEGVSCNCNRKAIWDALNVPSHESVVTTTATLRNFVRGETAEWRELRQIAAALPEGYTLIHQKEYKGETPKELDLPPINFCGIPVTGRCDGLVYKGKKLLYTIEIKCPRANAFKFNGDKPKASYIIQDGFYNFDFNTFFERNDIYGYNYILNDGNSEFGEWLIRNHYNGDLTEYIEAISTTSDEYLALSWFRITSAVQEGAKHIRRISQENPVTPQEKFDLLRTVPADPIDLGHYDKRKKACEKKRGAFSAYPCVWDDGASMCSYYPYCYEHKTDGLENYGNDGLETYGND